MTTSPDIVCLGEPLIEFNRPKEGDGRTWLQGFGGDSQNVAIAAARQGASTGYLTSVGQDWMGDAFLELWKSEGVDASRVTPPSDGADRRQLRHPRRGRPQVRLSAQELRRVPDDARRRSPRDYIAGAKVFHLSAIGQAISDTRPRDLRRRDRRRAQGRREGLLRHQPASAALGSRRRAQGDRRHHRALRRRPAQPRRFPAAHRPAGARRHRRLTISSSARRWWPSRWAPRVR